MKTDFLIKNCHVFRNGAFAENDILVHDGRIAEIGGSISGVYKARIMEFDGAFVFPGFADVHVHLREPGFSYKETIHTGTMAAARGGYTAVCAMPNVRPAPDSPAGLRQQIGLICSDAVVRVVPYGTITRGRHGAELSDMDALAPYVCGFSDDGDGVQSDELMQRAMRKAKALGRIIANHCEDKSAPPGESEWRELARDLELVRKTKCAYHVCHVSKKESLELIRRAKAEGLDVTCETAPHYFLLDASMLRDDGAFKMNPPIGLREDREALLAALKDGTIDMIATDHAPHSAEEKARGFKGSVSGITGLECAFPVLYTELVEKGVITLPRLIELMSAAPASRFGLGGGSIQPEAPADITVFDIKNTCIIDPADFLSMGKSTPFTGYQVRGRCLLTLAGGDVAWEEKI